MAKGYLDTQNMSLCCGCGSCADICPKSLIQMVTGPDKGRYPKINEAECIHCNLCRTVCPIEQPLKLEKSQCLKVFALMHEDEKKRMESASGGAFEVVAKGLFSQYPDLVIAGAAWETTQSVCHKILPAEERTVFKKSKYVQSDCLGIYRAVKATLEKNIHVLFTGTPCQVAALKKYLGKEPENLFTVDLICHGVPGNAFLEAYIHEIEKKFKSSVKVVSFREKRKDIFGEIHSDYVKIQLKSGKTIWRNKKTDTYLRAYHHALFYRESCYSCPYATLERVSDITIGDYWNIQSIFPNVIDYTGVSAMQINSSKGQKMLSVCSEAWIMETDPKSLSGHNGCLRGPTKQNQYRKQFLSEFGSKPFSILVDKYVGRREYFKNMLSNLLPGQFKRWIKNRGYRKWMKR